MNGADYLGFGAGLFDLISRIYNESKAKQEKELEEMDRERRQANYLNAYRQALSSLSRSRSIDLNPYTGLMKSGNPKDIEGIPKSAFYMQPYQYSTPLDIVSKKNEMLRKILLNPQDYPAEAKDSINKAFEEPLREAAMREKEYEPYFQDPKEEPKEENWVPIRSTEMYDTNTQPGKYPKLRGYNVVFRNGKTGEVKQVFIPTEGIEDGSPSQRPIPALRRTGRSNKKQTGPKIY